MAAGWSVEETRALVGVWGQANVQNELDGVTRNRVVYERIAKEMEELGYERTWQQCRTKIKNMTQKYRKVSSYTYNLPNYLPTEFWIALGMVMFRLTDLSTFAGEGYKPSQWGG